jgi:hypothetical protein
MLILNGLSILFSLATYKKSFFSKIFRFVPRGSSSRGSSSGVHRSQAAVVRRRAQNAAKPPLKEKGIVDKQLTREFKSFILLDAIPDLRDSMNMFVSYFLQNTIRAAKGVYQSRKGYIGIMSRII